MATKQLFNCLKDLSAISIGQKCKIGTSIYSTAQLQGNVCTCLRVLYAFWTCTACFLDASHVWWKRVWQSRMQLYHEVLCLHGRLSLTDVYHAHSARHVLHASQTHPETFANITLELSYFCNSCMHVCLQEYTIKIIHYSAEVKWPTLEALSSVLAIYTMAFMNMLETVISVFGIKSIRV